MKPHRLCMTHHLVMAYDLHKRMEIYVRTAQRALAYRATNPSAARTRSPCTLSRALLRALVRYTAPFYRLA
jgi:hypothetical protein